MKKEFLFACLFATTLNVSAQWFHKPTPNDTLQSVRHLSDGSAVFSIYAPQAQTVGIAGDIWAMNTKPVKADDGVWSITIPNVRDGVYRYHFVVDGVDVYDPIAPLAKETSALATFGSGNEFFQMKDVPHGAIAQRYYYSKNLKTTRRLHVWTPAGYEKSTETLPVLYLIHGGGDTDNSWPSVGCACNILDNLLAEGKMMPMIVVMPNGSIKTDKLEDEVPLFEVDLVNSIIPFIENNYRVKADAQHRALAGLSMGGMETLETMLNDYDKFNYFWVLSSGWWEDKNTYPIYQERLNKIAKGFNQSVKQLVFTMGGQEDIAYKNCQAMLKLFDKSGIKYQYTEAPGGHTWYTWRNNLFDLAQKIFR